ncbi:MAG: TIGR04086 family membrane protein [Clostridiaceae bacterium]|nr:TIGR04086 family membrane protein [Clostridiaceae bacterium]
MSEKKRGVLSGLSKGILASAVSLIVMLFVGAALTASGKLPVDSVRVYNIAAMFIAGIIGAVCMGKKIRTNRLPVCLINAVIIFVVIFLFGRAIWKDAVTTKQIGFELLAIMLGSIVGYSIITKRRRSPSARYHRK